MAFFPMYMDMNHLNVLVVGGGHIALEKLEKLVDFTDPIDVISQTYTTDAISFLNKHNLTYATRTYKEGDIDAYDIVIVATDGIDLHKRIFDESRNKRILVNSVDDTAYCDFIFPSYVKEGDLTISFSTSGASPAFAKHIRGYFERIIPKNVGAFLAKMKALRKEIPKGKARMKKFDLMAKEYIEEHFKSS